MFKKKCLLLFLLFFILIMAQFKKYISNYEDNYNKWTKS